MLALLSIDLNKNYLNEAVDILGRFDGRVEGSVDVSASRISRRDPRASLCRPRRVRETPSWRKSRSFNRDHVSFGLKAQRSRLHAIAALKHSVMVRGLAKTSPVRLDSYRPSILHDVKGRQ